MNNVHSLSANSAPGMDIERMGSEVERVATGLVALARLMQASNPEATDSFTDTPILHGLGFLLEAASSSLQGYGLKICNDGFDARRGRMNTPDRNAEDPVSVRPENLSEAPEIIGISSASGPSEHQEEIDARRGRMNTPDRDAEDLPDALPENLPEAPEIIGISSASGPSEHQEEIDRWIEEGGMPEFDDS